MSTIKKIVITIFLAIVMGISIFLCIVDQPKTSLNLAGEIANESIRYQFSNQLAKFSKNYQSVEDFNKALLNFQENQKVIDKYNAKNNGVQLGLNKFFDMDINAFKAQYLGKKKVSSAIIKKAKDDANSLSLAALKAAAASTQPTPKPDKRNLQWFFMKTTQTTTPKPPSVSTDYRGDSVGSFDWRSYNKITTPKDQLGCGSCYAFSSIGAMESLLLIKNQSLFQGINLSEQQIVDCTIPQGNEGCLGGYELSVYQYTSRTGIATENNYPYIGKKQICKRTGWIKTNSFQYYESNLSAVTIRKIIAKQPASIGICSSDRQFMLYKSGIFMNTESYKCCVDVDHAVLLIGWGKDKTYGNYWIIKNSWGTGWGEGGYMRIQMIEDTYEQTCGIGYDLTHPLIN
ncbi:UNKNOWN [Stylonychia lemnae]|uniref:Papain family cysteine protease n=1 Tax=Stylonychia lemnae TaxID=5949 RepID=A0A078B1A4_STYLE|nr:UNKNOWN [Stylonychia lemnae]|eukprot:CDW87137.1 UNKNOWN [Stylonychia lemnae]